MYAYGNVFGVVSPNWLLNFVSRAITSSGEMVAQLLKTSERTNSFSLDRYALNASDWGFLSMGQIITRR